MKFPRRATKAEEDSPKVQQTKPDEVKGAVEHESSSGDKSVKNPVYVYCIVPSTAPNEYGKVGVKDDSPVYTVTYKDIAAVVSHIKGGKFDRNDANILAHQRVVHKVFEQQMGVPVKFGAIFDTEEDVLQVLQKGYGDFQKQLSELASNGAGAVPSSVPSDIIAEILSQSAASAIRIRQLGDALETVKREQYERGAAKLPEGVAKELLEFLARAPKEAYQTSETPTSPEQIKALERRLDTLFEEIAQMRELMDKRLNTDTIDLVKKEEDEIKEAVMGLRAFQSQDRESIEKTISDAIKEQMNQISPARQVMIGTHDSEQTEPSGMPPSPVSALEPLPSWPPPNSQMQPYTRCGSCGAGIVITDRFCPHCGNPTF